MTRLEEWKQSEKERIDEMSIEDVMDEIDCRENSCYYCQYYYDNHMDNWRCGDECEEGMREYLEQEVQDDKFD